MPNLPNGPRSGMACSSEMTTDAWNAEFIAVERTQTFITCFRDQLVGLTSRRTWLRCVTVAMPHIIQSSRGDLLAV